MINENFRIIMYQQYKNSINDEDWNVFPKIYGNIKNLTNNVGFQPIKFVSVARSNY